MEIVDDISSARRRAVAAGLIAYLMWGFFGLYFSLLAHVEAFTILAHRVSWSLVFVAATLVFLKARWAVWAVVQRRGALRTLAVSSVLIATNWLIFIHATTHKQMVAASLGYFLTPLCNVLLGVAVLRERLRPLATMSVLLAAAGVTVLITRDPHDLWIPLGLAASFSLYALVRKQLNTGPLIGLFFETALLAPVAGIYLLATPWHTWAIFSDRPASYLYLIGAGVLTPIPLVLFAYAARSLRLSTLGFLQYIGPTVQLLAAVVFNGETISRAQLYSFALIWAGLALYTTDALRGARRRGTWLNPPRPPRPSRRSRRRRA